MARSKSQTTHAKRDRERARLAKRALKQEKKEARKLAAADDSEPTTTADDSEPTTTADDSEPTTTPDDEREPPG